MDYQHAFVPCQRDHFIYMWCKLRDPLGGAFAPVLVPHIADNDCGLFGIPLDFVLHNPELTQIIG
jgi:hypothetical protein